jgi:hypothetical protein
LGSAVAKPCFVFWAAIVAPYGQWLEDPKYGFVWSPDVDANFRPYFTNGYWAVTNYGNTWISEYPWGWAPFHYGRWTYNDYYGWLWIPGSNWGPAWVAWRFGEGYFGWAPLDPDYEFGPKSADYSCPADWWTFLPPKYLYTGNYYRYWYGPRNNTHLVHNTDFANNTYVHNDVTYVTGPRIKQVEDLSHQAVEVFKVVNSTNLNTRVHNGVVKMYRPLEIHPAATISGKRVMPPGVVNAPHKIEKPQRINDNPPATPRYKSDIPKNIRPVDAVGTHFNETAKPAPQPRGAANPYEWDVNKDIKKEEKLPEPVAQPAQDAPQPPAPAAKPAPNTKPQPAQPDKAKQAPAPEKKPGKPAPAKPGHGQY